MPVSQNDWNQKKNKRSVALQCSVSATGYAAVPPKVSSSDAIKSVIHNHLWARRVGELWKGKRKCLSFLHCESCPVTAGLPTCTDLQMSALGLPICTFFLSTSGLVMCFHLQKSKSSDCWDICSISFNEECTLCCGAVGGSHVSSSDMSLFLPLSGYVTFFAVVSTWLRSLQSSCLVNESLQLPQIYHIKLI